MHVLAPVQSSLWTSAEQWDGESVAISLGQHILSDALTNSISFLLKFYFLYWLRANMFMFVYVFVWTIYIRLCFLYFFCFFLHMTQQEQDKIQIILKEKFFFFLFSLSSYISTLPQQITTNKTARTLETTRTEAALCMFFLLYLRFVSSSKAFFFYTLCTAALDATVCKRICFLGIFVCVCIYVCMSSR